LQRASSESFDFLERLRASNCPSVFGFDFDVGPFALRGSPPPYEGVSEGFCPRRTILDKILPDAAAEAGAEVRQGVVVRELLTEGDRVVGIRAEDHQGSTLSERGRIVIGADGHHSLVSRAVEAPKYHQKERWPS
jgi:flavin-dependent dehydrogenase